MKAISDAMGLAIPTLGTYVSCADLASVELAMRGAVGVGAPCLRVNVPGYDGSGSWLAARDAARAQYATVADLAARFSVRALIELHMGSILPSASAAAAFVSGFDPACVGVIHDAGNMVYEGYEGYRLGLEALGPYLAHVHLKSARWDATGTRADGSIEWRASFAPLRSGVVDVAALFRALRAGGYHGWVSMEDFSTDMPLEDRLSENLAYARSVEDAVAGGR
jgi:sugar phosphate isomerase/epimerase